MHRIRTILTLTAALVACAGVSAGPALASSDQESIFQDGGNILSNPDGTLATLHSLGVTRIRVLISWNSVAPSATSRHKPRGFKATNPASYPAVNWARYDQALAAAKANGIAVDLDVIGPSPLWAVGPGVPPGGRPGPWRPSVSEFESFVTAVGTRYSGTYHGLPRVTFWSIWNEPNYGISLAPQATNHDTIEVGAWSDRNMSMPRGARCTRVGTDGTRFSSGRRRRAGSTIRSGTTRGSSRFASSGRCTASTAATDRWVDPPPRSAAVPRRPARRRDSAHSIRPCFRRAVSPTTRTRKASRRAR